MEGSLMDSQADYEVNETREDYIRRIAQNRYDFRIMCHMAGTAEGDWQWAERFVKEEDIRRCNDDKTQLEKLKSGGY